MPTVFAATESSILINGEAVEGVQAIDYRYRRSRSNIYAVGSSERIGVTSGPYDVEGRLRVASTSPTLDALQPEQFFQIVANFRHGEITQTVSFDDCFIVEKTFDLTTGGYGEAIYNFSAARVREGE